MSDLTNDQLKNFIEHPPLDAGDIRAFSKGATLIRVGDIQNNQSILMYVNEARALRDWLNKVLP